VVETLPSSFAPVCSPNVLLPLPAIKETNSTCTKKTPYVTIVIPEGATFEPLNPDGSCVSQSTSDGKNILVCTGKAFLEYDLKVCTPPIVVNSDLNKCAQGDTFNTANQCCVVAPPQGAGCILYKVKLKGCQ
jgi:hypothetical protein